MTPAAAEARRPSIPRVAAVLGLVVFAAAAVAGAFVLRPRVVRVPVEVDLSTVERGSQGPDPDCLNIAVAPIFVPRSSLEEYAHLAEYLGKHLGRRFRLVQRKTYGEVNELLRRGTVAFAIVCTGAYLEAWRNQIPLEGIACPVIRDRKDYNSYIIVRTESPSRKIEDLGGGSFAFTDPLSLSGHLYPHWLLLEHGLDPGTFFKRTVLSYSHDASIRAVKKGIVDAAAVDSLIYEQEIARDPETGAVLRIIHTSPPLPFAPVVTPAALDPAVRSRIAAALISMHEDPEGREILAKMNVDRFVAPDPHNLDFAIEIHERVGRYLRTR